MHPFDETARKYYALLADRDAIDKQLEPMESLLEKRKTIDKQLEELRGEIPAALKKKHETERLET